MSKQVIAYCNKCVGKRNHNILHSDKSSWSEEVGDGVSIGGTDNYEMLQCAGCDHICLRHSSTFSECFDENGPVVTERYYPPTISRSKPDWMSGIDSPFLFDKTTVSELLDEIYAALHNDSRRLAAMGVRALIEYMMIDKVGDKGSFNKNITAFATAGLLSTFQKDQLKTILEAGHASMHRDFKPSVDDLKTLLDITENLVAIIYVHKSLADTLSKKVPKRQE